jgi:7-keto-8-aminopelargonate synthetase-like enzyme
MSLVAKINMLLQVAVVTVAFPATPLLLARARICISASHTKEDLLKALEVFVLVNMNFVCITVCILALCLVWLFC